MTTSTCIVGFVDKNKKIIMGADSAGVAGLHIRDREDSKIFKKDNMIIGFTSSYRMGQLLRFKLKIPQQPHNISNFEYMCTLFIDAIRECLKSNGFTSIKDNKEEIGEFLVGYKNRIYKISEDLQVGLNRCNYDACGCGETYALASIYTNLKTKTGYQIVKEALECASYFSAGVRKPFILLELK